MIPLPRMNPSSLPARRLGGLAAVLLSLSLPALQPLAAQRADFDSLSPGPLAQTSPGTTDKPFFGEDGWSNSCGASPGFIVPASTSGEYLSSGFHLRGSGAHEAYIGAKDFFIPFDRQTLGMVFETLAAENAPVTSALWFDADDDFRYDLAETQMQAGLIQTPQGLAFGIQGVSGALWSSGIHPSYGSWYRIAIIHGEPDPQGNRLIRMRVRSLTAGTELDFNPDATGIQPWQAAIPAAEFGIAADQAHGMAIRVTGANAAIDNLAPLTYAKDGLNLLPLNDPRCWIERFIPGPADTARADERMSLSFRNSPLGASMAIAGFHTRNNAQSLRVGGTPGATLSLGAAGLRAGGPAGGLQFGCDILLTADQEWNVQPVTQFVPGIEFIVYSDYTSPTLDLGGFTATKTGPEDLWIRGGYDVANGKLVCAEGRLSLTPGGLSGDMKLASSLTLRAENHAMLSITNTGGGVPASSPIELAGGELNIGLDSFVLQPLTLAGPLTVTGDSKLSYFCDDAGTTSAVRFSLTGPLLGNGALHFIPSSPRPQADRIRLEGNNAAFQGRILLDAPSGNRTLQLRNATAGSAAATWEIANHNTLEIHGAAVQLGRLLGHGHVTNSHATLAATAIVSQGDFSGTLADGNAPLALTKSSPETFSLRSPQSYSGETQVLAGTLRTTQPNTLPDAATVRIAPHASLLLDFTGTDSIATLILDGTPQPHGLWGAPGSAANHTSPALAGTGLLQVGSAPATPFEDWIAAFPSLIPPQQTTPQADPDADSIANLLEWILGGDPTRPDLSILPDATSTPAGLTLRFARNPASIGHASLLVEWSADCQIWHPVPIPASSAGPDSNNISFSIDATASPHQVAVFLPSTLSSTGRLFARLSSTPAP